MAENDQTPDQQPATQTKAPETRFGVQRIYLKDASFEAPDFYEVVLRLTADVKQDNKTLFLVEVQQAGIFEVGGLEGERLEQVLTITCPTVLFPYGREAVDALVTKGSFPALMLAPVNFEAVYVQAKRKQAENAAPAGTPIN
jgi:preprotein translocase subunit SecB